MNEPVIISACRTPIGKFCGALSSLSAVELGAVAVRESLARSGLPASAVDEVIMGNVLSAGLGQAPARQVALAAGLPATVAALTINKMCGSGLKAVMLAAQAIRSADSDVVVAGGMESMSQAPYLIQGGRAGFKLGDQPLVDSMLHDGLVCPFHSCHMGDHAEHIAASRNVSRDDQDRFAAESQRRAAAALQSGAFREETVAVELTERKASVKVSLDEGPRPKTTLETLSRLPPAFAPNGSVTAGNSSQLSDGAAAVVVTSRQTADRHGVRPLARIRAYATVGVEPRELFIAPVLAIRKVLERAKLNVSDVDLFEINEAFAAQMVACVRELNLPADRVNVHGGAIALGHPIGASGARVLVTLLHALRRSGLPRGLAALCLGGGNAVAMIVELSLDES